MSLAQMTGLQLMQAVRDGQIPKASIAETIPMDVIEVEFGKVTFEAKADHRHLNPLGGVHGGFFATVLDSVTGCAVHSTLDANVGYGTVDLNVKMLKPIPLDVALIAQGNVINTSKSVAVAEGVIKDSNGTLYGHATATCLIKRS